MVQKDLSARYLCDGEMEECKKNVLYKEVCYKGENTGREVCKHTKDIRHAKNSVVMIYVFVRTGSEPSTLIENVFRFLSVEGGAMALIKSVKTVTKKGQI